jgi:GNAT superfamily N-acetyltransferase
MAPEPTLRRATPTDATAITAHRHAMFADNNFTTADRLAAMDATFQSWVTERLADGRYIGLLLEQEEQCLAAGGIFFPDFPPHWMHIAPERPYLLNFYTAPAARGRGYARLILEAAIDLCRQRNAAVISLHASPFGRPIYEQYGFEASTEMLLRLQH